MRDTYRGDKKAEEEGESRDKFVAKSERLLSVSTPLEVDRNAEDDEERSIEESLKNEAN